MRNLQLSRRLDEERYAWRPSAEQGAMLVELSELLGSQDCTARDLLDVGAARLAAVLGDTVMVSLLTHCGSWLQPVGIADPDPDVTTVLEPLTGTRFRADRGFSRHVLTTCAPLRLPATSPEVLAAVVPELEPYALRFGLRSLVVAPMRARGRPRGCVSSFRIRDAAPYSVPDARFIQLVADWLALGVDCGGWVTQDIGDAGAPPLVAALSDRQREILVLLALGHTNREVAERLVISVRTVEWHRARIQGTLGIRGRAALAAVARSARLIE